MEKKLSTVSVSPDVSPDVQDQVVPGFYTAAVELPCNHTEVIRVVYSGKVITNCFLSTVVRFSSSSLICIHLRDESGTLISSSLIDWLVICLNRSKLLPQQFQHIV